jgi:hypothetical protein
MINTPTTSQESDNDYFKTDDQFLIDFNHSNKTENPFEASIQALDKTAGVRKEFFGKNEMKIKKFGCQKGVSFHPLTPDKFPIKACKYKSLTCSQIFLFIVYFFNTTKCHY